MSSSLRSQVVDTTSHDSRSLCLLTLKRNHLNPLNQAPCGTLPLGLGFPLGPNHPRLAISAHFTESQKLSLLALDPPIKPLATFLLAFDLLCCHHCKLFDYSTFRSVRFCLLQSTSVEASLYWQQAAASNELHRTQQTAALRRQTSTTAMIASTSMSSTTTTVTIQPDVVADRVLRRAELGKMASRLQNRLALAHFKTRHGWEDLTLDMIEPKVEDEIRRKRNDNDVLSDSSSSTSDHPDRKSVV